MTATGHKKTKKAEASVVKRPTANVLTFQRHPLLQANGEDPDADDVLEILLRPDGARIAIYYHGDEGGRSHSLHVSPVDFEAFVECGRAHQFEKRVPTIALDDKDGKALGDVGTFREDPLLQIMNEKLDGKSYLEILLRPDGASFVLTASDHEGLFSELIVRLSPASFKAIVDRCRTHRFET